jgi:hypothetical protein
MKNTEKLTKKEIYATLIELVKAQGKDYANATEIIDRLEKDIELASKSATKKETDNDKFNKEIQGTILEVLKDGAMTYADFVKAVQGKYMVEVTPQKITANVTKVKTLIEKYEDGKGKNKKLYIRLATA